MAADPGRPAVLRVPARPRQRGGENASRCYQCATCSSVCELAPAGGPFPRRQMLLGAVGPGRPARRRPRASGCATSATTAASAARATPQPGDVMQTVRAAGGRAARLPAGARHAGRQRPSHLAAAARALPILFWVPPARRDRQPGRPAVDPDLPALEGRFHYEDFVPHLADLRGLLLGRRLGAGRLWVSGRRFWAAARHRRAERRGRSSANLVPALVEIATHKRFGKCDRGAPSGGGATSLLMWGFVGAAVTSGFAVLYLYGSLLAWLKLGYSRSPARPLGQVARQLLGGAAGGRAASCCCANRARCHRKLAGATTAFDRFFLCMVVGVIVTGVLTETFRFLAVPAVSRAVVYVAPPRRGADPVPDLPLLEVRAPASTGRWRWSTSGWPDDNDADDGNRQPFKGG